MSGFTESVVEDAELSGMESLGYRVLYGLNIPPGEPAAEREDYAQEMRQAAGQPASWGCP